MDLTENRAPHQLVGFLKDKDVSPQHWGKHRSISSCGIKGSDTAFRVDGICYDEAVHLCLNQQLDMVEEEVGKTLDMQDGQLLSRLKLKERDVDPKGMHAISEILFRPWRNKICRRRRSRFF
jgi:hypothetical protein